jgi:hypothetical protein
LLGFFGYGTLKLRFEQQEVILTEEEKIGEGLQNKRQDEIKSYLTGQAENAKVKIVEQGCGAAHKGENKATCFFLFCLTGNELINFLWNGR